MRLSLRTKMMLFAAVIAALPLLVAGQSIIRVARDELKSTANEQLVGTAREITNEFNALLEYSLYTSLDLVRNAIGGNQLGFESKVVILRQGIADLPDVVSLQVQVEGAPRPIVVVQQAYYDRLSEMVEEPLDRLRIDPDQIGAAEEDARSASMVDYFPETDDWIATMTLPISEGVGGRDATLFARINLNRLDEYVRQHPFARTGTIHVVNASGDLVFSTTEEEYDHQPVREAGVNLIESRNATIAVEPFELADGSVSLAAIAVPRAFPWAVLVEKAEADAYAPVADMIRNLLQWLALGILAALAGALVFALGLSRPILKIGEAAMAIAGGDLSVRVRDIRSRDEIGRLAEQFNNMIVQLNERFELQKFVSQGTMKAIEGTDGSEVTLGGERRRVTVLFADIRGYTAFSEGRDPEEVVEILNGYFERLAGIVVANHGDIDKFVGDEIMAVFSGERMEKHAVECSLYMMEAMEEMAAEIDANLRIGIGINVGEVVVGAMGSSQRKDFTVLGDPVNLAARLCGKAAPDQTLISKPVYESLPEKLQQLARKLPMIEVKGKKGKIAVYAFSAKEDSRKAAE